jgi:hypothetical protein
LPLHLLKLTWISPLQSPCAFYEGVALGGPDSTEICWHAETRFSKQTFVLLPIACPFHYHQLQMLTTGNYLRESWPTLISFASGKRILLVFAHL